MIWERFSLPLLTKELIEQAQSQRTYILRVLYAVVLYGAALFQYADLNNGGASAGLANLGRGQGFFQLLVTIQVYAILILLPAMTCGALTVEKEKDTLALLLLTKLSPFTIVLEKLLSRVLAMGTYQLLSLPLFAIVYGMGGVELSTFILSITFLVCLTFVVGSVAIVCSTWFRTTSEAFITTYVIVFFLGFCCSGPFAGSVPLFAQGDPGLSSSVLLALIPGLFMGLATLVAMGICLSVSSEVLVARAFVPARNILLEMFQAADRFFNELNQKTTGGIVLVPDHDPLPVNKPVFWRETRKRSLGTFRYQFRILVLLLAPLIVVIASVMMDGRNDFSSPFRRFPIFFWTISVVCLTVHSTGVIAAERVRQSLDVLLVTPLSSDEIVLEKLSGVRRLIKILTVPFVVLILFQAIWTGYVLQGSRQGNQANFWLEICGTSLSVVVYMPLIMWIGYQLGLRFHYQIQAVIATFAILIGLCLVPLVAARSLGIQSSLFEGLRWLSPLPIIFIGADSAPEPGGSLDNVVFVWLAVIVHFALYTGVWYLLRRDALKTFSKIVRRTEATSVPSGHQSTT